MLKVKGITKWKERKKYRKQKKMNQPMVMKVIKDLMIKKKINMMLKLKKMLLVKDWRSIEKLDRKFNMIRMSNILLLTTHLLIWSKLSVLISSWWRCLLIITTCDFVVKLFIGEFCLLISRRYLKEPKLTNFLGLTVLGLFWSVGE